MVQSNRRRAERSAEVLKGSSRNMTQQLIVYFRDHCRVVDGFRDPETELIDTGWLANELAGVNQFTPLVLPLVGGDVLVLASLDGVVFEVTGG